MQNLQIVKTTNILSRQFKIHTAKIGNQSVYAYEFKSDPITLDYVNCRFIRNLLSKVDNYFICEYVKGALLSNLLNASPNLITNIVTKIALTLYQIWKQGFLGRVFNVDNILLLEDGQILFMDFGSEGQLPYSPPEMQFQQNYSHRTDMYLVGRILFYLMTGYSVSNLRQYSETEINSFVQKSDHPRSMMHLCVALLKQDSNMRPLIVETLGMLNFNDSTILNEIRSFETNLKTNLVVSQLIATKWIINFLEISELSNLELINNVEVRETIRRCEQLMDQVPNNSFNFSSYIPPILDMVEYHLNLYNSRFEMMKNTCKLIKDISKASKFMATSIFCIEKMRLIQMNTQIKELQQQANILAVEDGLWNEFTQTDKFNEQIRILQITLVQDMKQLKQLSQDIQGIQKDDFLSKVKYTFNQLSVDVQFQDVKLSYRFYLKQLVDEVIQRKSKVNDTSLEVLYLYLILCSAINLAYVPYVQCRAWRIIYEKIQSYDLNQYIESSDIEEICALSQLLREMYFSDRQI